MPWTVAAIGITCFLVGLATANGLWTLGGVLTGLAVGAALVLRWYVITTIEHAFQAGAGYGDSTRRRIRDLPEAHDVPKNLKRKKWLNGGGEDT